MFSIPGAIEQLQLGVAAPGGGLSATAHNILGTASDFQTMASNTRLQPRVPNKSLIKAGMAAAVQRERRDKKDVGNLMVRLSATLWQFPPPVRGICGKMQQVPIFILFVHL